MYWFLNSSFEFYGIHLMDSGAHPRVFVNPWTTSMNALTLPESIAAYFAAEHRPEALARCFTPQAVLKDDGHTCTGVDAITAFMAEASAKYRATSAPFALENDDGLQTVRATVTGDFRGSPIDLSYRFRLERGLIASLEITA